MGSVIAPNVTYRGEPRGRIAGLATIEQLDVVEDGIGQREPRSPEEAAHDSSVIEAVHPPLVVKGGAEPHKVDLPMRH